jgi:hypothetical protein
MKWIFRILGGLLFLWIWWDIPFVTNITQETRIQIFFERDVILPIIIWIWVCVKFID